MKKILFTHQGPHKVHGTFARTVTKNWYYYGDNQPEIIKNLLFKKDKICKIIENFIKEGSGPVNVVTSILNIKSPANWDEVKKLPNNLLVSIRKVANTMIQSIERRNRGQEMILKNPKLGLEEFRIVRNYITDSSRPWIKTSKNPEIWGIDYDSTIPREFTTVQIWNPLQEETKMNKNMLLKVIEFDYVPRLYATFISEIDRTIYTNNLIKVVSNSGILEENKDIERLKKLDYNQLLNLYNNIYREPTFYINVPIEYAYKGVWVYPLRYRNGFLIGGNFPLTAKSYRYIDIDRKVKTKLVEICQWLGNTTVGEDVIEDIYSQNVKKFEEKMIECVKKLQKSRIWIKIQGDDIVNSRDTLSVIINEFDMKNEIEKNCIDYFMKYGGIRSIFPNGGTREEYESFLNSNLYTDAMKRLFGVLFRMQKTIVEQNTDKYIKVSILKSPGGQEIYRKLNYSEFIEYPVPMGYDDRNYPIYNTEQKPLLAELIESGHLSPWYKNRIQVVKSSSRGGDIEFIGDVPFVIAPYLAKGGKIVREKATYTVHPSTLPRQTTSHYYVEQIFSDEQYGLPIVTRIGIIPNKVNITKFRVPEDKYVIKDEPYRIEYFKGKLPKQNTLIEFKMNMAQMPMTLNKSDLVLKSGYSIIDPRMLKYNLKYEPDDVWTWDPLEDRKAGMTKKDIATWTQEKEKIKMMLQEKLKKMGSSSSVFIADKNEATRYLQLFRINLPSQINNRAKAMKFRKNIVGYKDHILRGWNKYVEKFAGKKDKLINEAHRLGYYEDKMSK